VLTPEVTERTWAALCDPSRQWTDSSPNGRLSWPGLLTWSSIPRRLNDAVYAFADGFGAASVYWLTQEYNAPARSLYDTLAHRTSMVVYQR
jgi:hypothetical protein